MTEFISRYPVFWPCFYESLNSFSRYFKTIFLSNLICSVNAEYSLLFVKVGMVERTVDPCSRTSFIIFIVRSPERHVFFPEFLLLSKSIYVRFVF